MTVAELARLKAILAKDIRSCLAASAPADRANAERAVCATLSRLVQEFLRSEDTWDSQYTRLDGVLPLEVRTDSETLKVSGGAIVVSGDRWSVFPLRATLRLSGIGDDFGSCSIFFGEAASSGLPYRPGMKLHRLRFPVEKEDWAYTFSKAAD